MKRPYLMLAALAGMVLVGAMGGCSSISYYLQSIGGHLDLMGKRRSIEAVMEDPATPPQLREKLARVAQIRDFASRQLALPDNGSYRQYADLERPFVVWNVFATPELSVRLKEWCFPVAGCVAYRGYFGKPDAEGYARGLKEQGHDVYVGGVPAYSTLGWFDDPVLNTFVNYPDAEVARLVFHELAHQVVYVKNDSVFNESFATAVEMEGMRRWLAAQGTGAQRAAFDAAQERKRAFIALVLDYRGRLDTLFRSEAGEAEKRAGKAKLYAELARDYESLVARWGGYRGYDRWLAGGVNNAALASVAAYTQQVPAFRALLAQSGGDLPTFYGKVGELGALPLTERNARLAALAAETAESDAAPALSAR